MDSPLTDQALAAILSEVHCLLTHGILHYLPEAAPLRVQDEAWESAVREGMASAMEREASLAVEVANQASSLDLALTPGCYPLAYSAYHFLDMRKSLAILLERANEENDRIHELKGILGRDPELAPLLSKVLSTRRELHRRLARLGQA